MEHKFLSLAVFSSLYFFSFAQQNTTASGGNATGTGGSVSYSVGQTDYISASGPTGSINQGVQQVYQIEDVSGVSELSSLVSAVFPNPTNGLVSLEIRNTDLEMQYELRDVSGRNVASGPIRQLQTTLDLGAYANGEYLLHVSSGNHAIKTFKIVKH